MNTYTRVHQGLLRGGMTPNEATGILARLQSETGAALAAALRAHNRDENTAETDGAAPAIGRRRKARFGATLAAANWIEKAAATGRRFTAPHQRDNRSTS